MNTESNQVQLARHVLSTALMGAYTEAAEPAGPGGPRFDFILVHPPRRHAVEIVSVPAPRIADVIGRFATAILRINAAEPPSGAECLVAVVMPSFGQKVIVAVTEFMSQYAPKLAWALVDFKHRLHFADPQAGRTHTTALDAPADSPAPPPSSTGPRTSRLFTDLNSWMLKILLLSEATIEGWPGPRERIDNPTRLSRVAKVAVQTAHSFFKTFAEHGFVRMSQTRGVHVVRARALLELWLAHEQQRPVVRTFARSVYGVLDNWKRLAGGAGQTRFALGGFDACRRHGVLHTAVSGVPVLVHGESVPALVGAWDLQYCSEAEAQLVFVNQQAEESVFRGVIRQAGVPVVDILQAALDVAPMPNRGIEQAELIVERILERHGE